MSQIVIREWQPSDSQRSDRSAGDRSRHRFKVREAIRDNIADIVAEESIIGQSRDRIVKIPIRGIKEYRFVFGDNAPGVGQGDGQTQPGQVVKSDGDSDGQGGKGAGDSAGKDYYETEITLEELVEIMFEDLELPQPERKNLRQIQVEQPRKFAGYRRKGIRSRLSLRRSAVERVRRVQQARHSIQLANDHRFEGNEVAANFLEARSQRIPFREEDLRYRHHKLKLRPESNAVVVCIMDTSASMDTMKKYLARSFFFLLHGFVSTKYQNVELVFIAHHTEAKEVTEEEFFHKGESGGTFISSGYDKALEIIEARYHPSLWNIYAFHCSDGDNFDEDNERACKAARELCQVSQLFGYGEIKPSNSYLPQNSLLEHFSKKIQAENYKSILISKKEEVWPAFKEFLKRERPPA